MAGELCSLVVAGDFGLWARLFFTVGAFNSHLITGSLSCTVESGCWTSWGNKVDGLIGWNADLTTSMSSSSDCSEFEWSIVECILWSLVSGHVMFTCGLELCLLDVGDNLSVSWSIGDAGRPRRAGFSNELSFVGSIGGNGGNRPPGGM